MTSNLCVAGCSVSDYTDVEDPYGKILAKNLGLNYIHEAAGCGSNYRIWRRITNLILNKTLTERDIVIIQYTEVIRTEFWSMFFNSKPYTSPAREASHNGGEILRWKPQSYTWQPFKEEQNFFLDYEKYFCDIDFSEEVFLVHNYNFQHMLMHHKIKTIFFITTRNNPTEKDFILDYFKPFVFYDDTNKDLQLNLREGDVCHFSQLGHDFTADKLSQHIKSLGWI